MNSLFAKILVIHPILFGIFFVIVRYNDNLDELVTSDLFFALSIIIPIIIVFSIIMRIIIRDTTKSLLVSSLTVTLFFIYIPLHNTLFQFQIGGLELGRHMILLPIMSICSLITIILFIKSRKNYKKLLEITYIIILALIAFNTIEIVFYSDIYSYSTDSEMIQNFANDDHRDVYHIVLDEHASTGALKKYLNYDNSDFDNALKEMGFFIPDESYSNYMATRYSVPSMLNMNYIHSDLPTNEKERVTVLQKIVKNNIVTKIFEKNGYQTVSFYNEFNLRTINDPTNELCNNSVGNLLFFSFIIDNTPLSIVGKLIDPGNYNNYAENRLCVFDRLPNLDKTYPHPTFVFAHIMLPHDPFIFDADGNINAYEKSISADKLEDRYLSQLEFTDSKTLQVVKKLLTKDPQPIIIIQSDHGYRSDHHDSDGYGRSFSNFAAFYFPETELKDIPQDLSFVNTYRIVFNYNFGTNYDLLENKMYVTDEMGIAKDVTNMVITNRSSTDVQ